MRNNRKKLVAILAGIMALMMLLTLLAGLIPRAGATSSSEIKDQIEELKDQQKELKEQMKDLENKIDDNMGEMERIAAEKDIIDQEIFLLHEQVNNINEQIRVYGLLIADKQEELDAARARLQELTEINKERIKAMEENGKLSYWSVLFEANSFGDFLDRLNMVEEIHESDKRRLQALSDAANEVAAAQQELEQEKAALEITRDELAAAQLTLEEKRQEADQLLVQLNAKGQEYEAMMDRAEADAEELLADIAKKEKEYTEAKRQEYLQWLSTSVPETTKPKPSYSGGNSVPDSNVVAGIRWVIPINYRRLSSPYGWRIHPVYGDRRFHSGVDLAAAQGTPIYATRSGTVTTATYNSSAGYYVTINHGDGFSSSYLHMTHYTVKVGQSVSAGQVIGYCGSTGTSTGPHLHFTLYYNGSTVNPANYINFY